MNGSLRFSPTVYRAMLEDDARKFGIPFPKIDELRQPFIYVEELRTRKRVTTKDPLDTAHLRISLEVSRRNAAIEGQTFGADHLVLRLDNRTDGYLAYRVATEISDPKKCQSKGQIPHNALVIGPKETIKRTECLYRASSDLDVIGIEVIEIPQISAYYLGRLPASAVLFDPRTATGHVPLKGTPCAQTFSWQEIKDGMERKILGWKDVIDYYARHSCEEYAFFGGYHYRTDATAPLPVRPAE